MAIDPTFMHLALSCRGQRSRAYVISFNECVLHIASIAFPEIEESLLRSESEEGQKSFITV